MGLLKMESDAHCKHCEQALTSFASEIAIHLHFPEAYRKRHAFVFPRLSVCLNCGLVQFKLRESQIEQLRRSTPTPIESNAA